LVNLYYTATRGAILGFIGAILLTSFLIAIFEKKRIVLKRTCWGIGLHPLHSDHVDHINEAVAPE